MLVAQTNGDVTPSAMAVRCAREYATHGLDDEIERENIEALLHARLGRGPEHKMLSQHAESEQLGMDPKVFGQLKSRCTAFMHFLTQLATDRLAGRLLSDPQVEIVYTMRLQVFDETPACLSVRVATE